MDSKTQTLLVMSILRQHTSANNCKTPLFFSIYEFTPYKSDNWYFFFKPIGEVEEKPINETLKELIYQSAIQKGVMKKEDIQKVRWL